MGIQCVVLEYQTDIPLLRHQGGHIPVAEHDFAVRNTLQTGNHVESRRLAASARAKKSRQLPVLEYNIDVVDCGGLAKLFCQIFYSNFHLCTPPQ